MAAGTCLRRRKARDQAVLSPGTCSTLMARKINSCPKEGPGHARETGPELKERSWSGDENRTRTISLGSGAVTAARGPDLASLAVMSDRG